VKSDAQLLDDVLGPGVGETPEERAIVSTRRFVRGLDMLTAEVSEKARGRRLTATEALESYGFGVLAEVAAEGSAIISESVDAAGRALRERRDRLGLDIRAVARRTGLAPVVIEAIEASKRRPIREYERVARVLGLDERMLSFQADPATNERLAVRLRLLRDEGAGLSSGTVATLAEAAWVTTVQARLQRSLRLQSGDISFQPLAFFGSWDMPAYQVGYDLADKVRDALGRTPDQPIDSLRDVAEKRLGIMVLHAELAPEIGGATVQSGDGSRAIVLNIAGRNQNVYVARSTLAHELCHVLFDPPNELRELRVDAYAALDERPDQVTDRVEARANAFAVQLLAPQDGAVRLYDETTEDPLDAVLDHYGISFTAARYQIWNGKRRGIDINSIRAVRGQPDPAWEGRERYTASWHPLRELGDHPVRAGRFSAVVLRAADVGLISYDTAAEYLCTTQPALELAASQIRELYADVFMEAVPIIKLVTEPSVGQVASVQALTVKVGG